MATTTPSTSTSTSAPLDLSQLTPDEIDDILYLTRTNDTAELLSYIQQVAENYALSPAWVLEACVDEYTGNTVLHYAAANGSSDLISSLLPLLTTPNTTDTKLRLLNTTNKSGNTPLHWASLNGHASTVSLLTTSGAAVWVKNGAGNLPVFEAERAGKDEVVAILLLAGGKEVEDELASKEGGVSEKEEREVEGQKEEVVVGAGSADEAADRLAEAKLD